MANLIRTLDDGLSQIPLPIHRAKNHLKSWAKKYNKNHKIHLNEYAIKVIEERVMVMVERFGIKAEDPLELVDTLNGLTIKYNGLIYEEDGVIMEIDLFENSNKEPFYFGIGDTPIFNKYLYDNYPELLI